MKKRHFLIFISIILLFFALIIFSKNYYTNANTNIIEITNVEELSDVIANQKSNQTWIINQGIYDLTENQLNKYKDWKNPTNSSQGNWYFPIYENNITILGKGDVTITSSVETSNEAWASQDFLSIWGDNITINNIDIKSKKSQNKAIEIMGKNFTLKNSTIKELVYEGSNNKVFSGSIYFNPLNNDKDVGNSVLENVYIFSYISASQVKKGNIYASNLTLNFTNNVWSEWGEGYGPALIGDAFSKVENITYIVDNSALWNELISSDYIYSEDTKPGTTIKLAQNIILDKTLNITRSDITIDLNSHKISASNNFSNLKNDENHLIMINDVSNVTIKSGTVETSNNTKNGININSSKGITLENMIINNKSSLIGAIPLSISNSNANIKGNLELHVNDDHLHGINISSTDTESSLNFLDNSYVSIKGKDTFPVINLEGNKNNINISGATNAGLEIDEKGNFIKHTHFFSDNWIYNDTYHWKECSCREIIDKHPHIFVWIIDKESTTYSKGLKHQECSICNFKNNECEIPIIGTIDSENLIQNENINSTFINENINVEESNFYNDNKVSLELPDDKTIKKSNNLLIGIYFMIVIFFVSILIIIILRKNKN